MTDKVKRQLDFCGISEYHRKGYTGKGIVIFNHELDIEGQHGEMTTDVLQLVAPKATIINGNLQARYNPNNIEDCYFRFKMFDGEVLSPLDMYEKYKPDIISVSFSGRNNYYDTQIQPLIDKGVILFCSAGNEGDDGVTGKYENIGILVGAAQIRSNGKVSMLPYSGYDKDEMSVDITGFMGDGSGTSAACPFVSGQCALILNKYNKMSQSKFLEFIDGKTFDVNADGDDVKSGKGILIMPQEIISHFNDVSVDRWSAEAIEYCRANGIMNGVGDNNFDPTGVVTREQLAQVIYRQSKE